MLLPNPDDNLLYASIDEAGRGSLVGCVVSACVIWQPTEYDHLINDSKKITPKLRRELSDYIKANAIDYSITFIDQQKIDEINILNATLESMHRSLDKLNVNIDHILVDGNKFNPYKEIPHTCIIQGDAKYISIAAASILAKVARDEYMIKLANEYPEYGWSTNMGYGTHDHIESLKKLGPTPYHRKTFIKNFI
jgi:ribonuclease HII